MEEINKRLVYDRLIQSRITIDNETGCWNWSKHRDSKGYGKLTLNYKILYAHRVSYSRYIGEIPKGMHVCHKCDNPPCVNPDHLFLGTCSDNIQDMYNKGRHSRKLSIEDWKEIKTLVSKGQSQRSIASIYDVSQASISYIVNK